ncbi:MAG: helicase-exonuclease AddAB subunit AddA, partial [Clostridia bacterium]|nr:helicase-exonuclease AddAB subunit AddA [Clostridia bacterium]
MATNWTEEQSAAIASREQNLLVSAAAGSGKTAVLVGRIISRLTDDKNPIAADRLLVVTFTNAAAAEMRERILNALTSLTEEHPENAFLANQLLLVKKAQITTIDSFCIDLLRQNFVAANLSPDFRIADPTENNVLRDEILDEVLTEFYDDAEYAEDFFKLLEAYANAKANDKAFRELVHSLFQFVMSLPNPTEWLETAAEQFQLAGSFEESPWCKAVQEETKQELYKCVLEYNTMIYLASQDGFSAYEALLRDEQQQFIKAMEQDTYDGLREAVLDIVFKTRPRIPKDLLPKYAETIHAMRDKVKKARIAKLREKSLAISAAQQRDAILNTYPAMRCLSRIVIGLKDRFFQRKIEKNVLDFNDCEHLCLDILVDEKGKLTDTALAIQEKYDEIYIDEYQDTSRLQEAIFSAVKKSNNLFMVGDIKQSIYRFRNTDPSLFRLKQETFLKAPDAENRKIILSKNFRSRENVLASVNFLFERIMSTESGEIDYNQDEMLYFGANFPNTAVCPISSDTELCLIDTSSVKSTAETEELMDLEMMEISAIYTANKIADLIESGEQVYDGGVYRPMRYSDICVLSRNAKDVSPILSSVLTERGIPCFSENTGGFLNSSEITTMISMLSVIDNPLQDLPLLSVLRSVLFGFSAETLARIRCCDKHVSFYEAMALCAKLDMPESVDAKEALSMIRGLIDKSKYMHVSELVQNIYHMTGFYDAQQTMVNGEIRRANLRLFYNRAKEFEKTGMKGLYSFLQFIRDYHAAGGDFDAAKVVGAEQDAVRIMSIHKSKGLEFPV